MHGLWGTHASVSENVEVPELWQIGVERTVAKLKDNFKTFPQDGKWMSAYNWKVRIEKELRERLKNYGGGLILNEFIKEVLGE